MTDVIEEWLQNAPNLTAQPDEAFTSVLEFFVDSFFAAEIAALGRKTGSYLNI
jgi:hypothetical protein